MTIYERIGVVVCIFCDSLCHRHFMLDREMYYFIERFDYVLVSSVIINAEMSVISSVVAFRPSVTQNIFYHKIN